jgi:hypothetical protein
VETSCNVFFSPRSLLLLFAASISVSIAVSFAASGCRFARLNSSV